MRNFDVYGLTVTCERRNLEGLDGQYDPVTATIYIDYSVEDKDLNRVIIHELGHAIAYRAGLSQAISKRLIEIISEQFAVVLDENGFTTSHLQIP